MATTQDWVKVICSDDDFLFSKLTKHDEGWAVETSLDEVRDVPLNALDSALYKLALISMERKQKLVFAMPRIKRGVALSLASYLLINRFLSTQFVKKGQMGPRGFSRTPIPDGSSIIVATKNRRSRDYFLASSFLFAGSAFSLKDFPIGRITRKGELKSLIPKSSRRTEIGIEPIIFYHLDELQEPPALIPGCCLIGEVSEVDSIETIERLIAFGEAMKASSSFIFVNEFADLQMSTFQDAGYKTVCLAANQILDTKCSGDEDLPSLSGSLASCPANISISLDIVDDAFVSSKLSFGYEVLDSLAKRIDSENQSVLSKAWRIINDLRLLAVPLDRYEAGRKRHPYIGSLKRNIEKTFKRGRTFSDVELAKQLLPFWGTLGAELTSLYDYLGENNNKYAHLEKVISSNTEKTTILFPTKMQSEIAKEELLLEHGWVQGDGGIIIGYYNETPRLPVAPTRVVLVGAWRPSDTAKILALFAESIHIICYSRELPFIKKMLSDFEKKEAKVCRKRTIDNLINMGVDLPSATGNTDGINCWLSADKEAELVLRNLRSILRRTEIEVNESEPFEELVDYVEDDSRYQEGDDGLEDGGTELVAVVTIILEGGKKVLAPHGEEVFAYSEDNQVVQQKLSDELEAGDFVLLYSADSSQEMFEELVQRTRELSRVDQRVMSVWRDVINFLRDKYLETRNLKDLVSRMRGLGCTKHRLTITQWLKGSTLAPRDRKDIERILQVVNTTNAEPLSRIIEREIKITRAFNQALGKRLHRKMSQALNPAGIHSSASDDVVSLELDEILEAAEPYRVEEVLQDTIYQRKEIQIREFLLH